MIVEIQNSKLLFDEHLQIHGTLEENIQQLKLDNENQLIQKQNEINSLTLHLNEREQEIQKLQDEMKMLSKRVVEIEVIIREVDSEKRQLIQDNQQLSLKLV